MIRNYSTAVVEIREYFETYIPRKKVSKLTCRKPPFPMRFWSVNGYYIMLQEPIIVKRDGNKLNQIDTWIHKLELRFKYIISI